MSHFHFLKNIRTACALLIIISYYCCSHALLLIKRSPLLITTGFSKVFNQGPVSLTMQLNSTDITIAEQLELVLLAAIPEEYEVEMPSYTTTLGDFSVDDFHTSPPRMTGAAINTRIGCRKNLHPGTLPARHLYYPCLKNHLPGKRGRN